MGRRVEARCSEPQRLALERWALHRRPQVAAPVAAKGVAKSGAPRESRGRRGGRGGGRGREGEGGGGGREEWGQRVGVVDGSWSYLRGFRVIWALQKKGGWKEDDPYEFTGWINTGLMLLAGEILEEPPSPPGAGFCPSTLDSILDAATVDSPMMVLCYHSFNTLLALF